MTNHLMNQMILKMKEKLLFRNQSNAWQDGFISAIDELKNEFKHNNIVFMPTSLKQEMLAARVNEYSKWYLTKKIDWEISRLENNQHYVYISTNNSDMAKMQIEKLREEFCYISMCNAYHEHLKNKD